MEVVSFLVNIIALFWGVYCYANNKKGSFLFVLFLGMTSFLKLLPVSFVSPTDFSLVLCFAALVVNFVKEKKVQSLKGDGLGKAILLYLGYIAIRSLFAVYLGEESPMHIFLVVRSLLFWLTYFLFKDISVEDFNRGWKKIYPCVVVVCVLSLLQYGGFSFSGYLATPFGSRLRLPVGADLLLLWALCAKNKNLLLRTSLVCLILLYFVLGVGRFHIILSIFFSSIILLSKIKIAKKGVTVFLGIVLVSLTIFAIIKTDALNGVGRFGEIQNDIQTISDISQTNAEKGSYLESGNSATMTFRLVLAKERWVYLLRNSQYLLPGVGPIYDDPKNPYNKFNFYLGTARVDRSGIHQIDCVDIAFVTCLFRYGVIGLTIFLGVIIALIVRLAQGKKFSPLMKATFFSMLMITMQFTGSNVFDRFQFMFLILIAAGAGYNAKQQEKLRNCNS